MNRVIVVESGAKTKTIRQFLRGEYQVIACGGHIVDLPDDDLGIDVDADFAYETEPIVHRGRDKVESVRDRLADADEVYLATDPDREGEAIAADLAEHCVPEGVPVHRIAFNAIVYHAVAEALENPRAIDGERVEAQRARRSLDRLVGFVLSAMAKFDPEGPGVPSVGRVQSPAVALVVDREEAIQAFEPRRYWTLHGRAAVNGAGGAETQTLDEAGDTNGGPAHVDAVVEGEWEDFDAVKEVVDELEALDALVVESCEIDPEDTLNPLPPYTTDMLQDEADFLLNLPPERTMRLAQTLYEGVEVEGKTQGLITYMRTDSTRVAPQALNQAKAALGAREGFGEDRYKGRTWAGGEGAQDAHEAIRPAKPEDPATWPENLEDVLDEDMHALYAMIYWRFLASQMVPAVYEKTTIVLSAGEGPNARRAEAVGRRLLDPGFLDAYRRVREGHGHAEVDLPRLEAGAELALERAWPEPQETRPPPRFREGSLVRELKERGIGRPSTYSEILSKIKLGRYGYVRKAGGKLRPTEKGEALVEYLRRRFDHVVDYEYTARMERALDEIEAGELSYEEFLAHEFAWLREHYEAATAQGWMAADIPTPAQIEYLESLAVEAEADVPKEVFESKRKVSQWIDKLREEIQAVLRLGPVHQADAGGVPVWRFRLHFNKPLPDEEHAFLKAEGMKYRRGGKGQAPCYQYQRQDRSVVDDLWDALAERYAEEDVLPEVAFEVLDEEPHLDEEE